MKGTARKRYLLVLLIFILASLSVAWFAWYYRLLVIKLHILSTSGKIHFVGKNFLFFASEYSMLSFGVFCSAISFRLFISDTRKRLLKIILTVVSFFLATAIICYINSMGEVLECTACNDGIKKLNYGNVSYDTIFIGSLGVSLLVFIVSDLITQAKRNER